MHSLPERLQSSLGDAYRLDRELGGSTFLAHDVALGRPVVVKTLPAALAAALSAERFVREIALVAPLRHRNVVPVLSAGVADGVPYYLTSYVEGVTARERLRGAPRGLRVAEAVSVLRDVASALDHAHAEGVVHRDVKPENVVLGRGGAHASALVTDFGVARAVDLAARDGAPPTAVVPSGTALTRLGHAVGTPGYMAPEQIAGDPALDHRADLYAWGVLAYELLAGAPPFVAATPQELVAATLTAAPPPLGARRPDVPPGLAALVARCLEKAAARRPSSARAVLDALDEIPPFAERRISVRRRWVLVVSVAAVVALLGAVLLLAVRGR
jgi:serine/threonine-protein kinase